MNDLIIDLFAGPGGWSEGIRQHLGLRDVGLEWDTAAVKTRAAAGHTTIQCDVAQYPTGHLAALIAGLIGSPPCTLFSGAGTGIGRLVLDILASAIIRIFRGEDCRQEARDAIYPVALAEREKANAKRAPEKRWMQERIERVARDDAYCAALVLEPARFIAELLAAGGCLEWVALEQVTAVLPLWRVYARCLRQLGWSVYVGILNSANYGVPQTRDRAIFAASHVRTVAPPEPTHAAQAEPPSLFGASRKKYISMAEALGLNGGLMVNTRGDRKTPGGNEFSADGPSWALTEKTRSWTLHTNRDQRPDGTRQTIDPHSAPASAPALTGKSGGQWVLVSNTQANAAVRRLDEPASTLFFGHRGNAVNWTDGEEKRPLTVTEAAVLQSFRADYPWQGSKTKQFEQIGNAVPPLLAAHIVSAATGIPMRQEVAA